MGKAERQGYTSWDNLLKTGAVGDDVLWTDDEIYRSCTLGELRKTIGTAFPIDLAVAYTLGSVGRDRGLTVDDMVNDYTRRATILMNGKVGFGKMPIPEADSCGHDMVDAFVFTFPRLRNDSNHLLHFRGNTSVKLKDQLISTAWVEEHGEVPEEVIKLTSFRLDKSCGQHFNVYETLFSDTFKPLLDYLIGCGYDKMSYDRTGCDLIRQETKGECGYTDEDVDEDGNKKICSHHSPAYETNWWLIKDRSSAVGGVRQIWTTGKGNTTSNGYHNNQLKNSYLLSDLYNGWYREDCLVKSEDVIRFTTIARQLVNNLDDKLVKQQIRKSLNRMKNWSGRNLLSIDMNGRPKRGKHTKYSWSNWNWLENVHTMAKYTNSKNRKIGDRVCTKCYAAGHTDEHGNGTCLDTCNEGWLYNKYDTYHIHGNEISKYRWIPIMGNAEGVDRPHLYCFDSWPHLNMVYATAQELIFARKTFAAASNRLNGMKINADWDESKDARSDISDDDMKGMGFRIDKIIPRDKIWVALPAEIHPEEFSTAWDLYKGAFNGGPEFFEEFAGLFAESNSFRIYRRGGDSYKYKTLSSPDVINVDEETIEVINNE
tara:strand:- start:4885 stop:6678 length:1794 start_codon:yes stop_codon:yes gene_type:complete